MFIVSQLVFINTNIYSVFFRGWEAGRNATKCNASLCHLY